MGSVQHTPVNGHLIHPFISFEFCVQFEEVNPRLHRNSFLLRFVLDIIVFSLHHRINHVYVKINEFDSHPIMHTIGSRALMSLQQVIRDIFRIQNSSCILHAAVVTASAECAHALQRSARETIFTCSVCGESKCAF